MAQCAQEAQQYTDADALPEQVERMQRLATRFDSYLRQLHHHTERPAAHLRRSSDEGDQSSPSSSTAEYRWYNGAAVASRPDSGGAWGETVGHEDATLSGVVARRHPHRSSLGHMDANAMRSSKGDAYPSPQQQRSGSSPSSSSSPYMHECTSTASEQGRPSKYRKRSRAPAPGSCLSCHAQDTPEWRRGPGGARTLCNACGLHYAKIVRRKKQDGDVDGEGEAIVTIDELRASVLVSTPTSGQAKEAGTEDGGEAHLPSL